MTDEQIDKHKSYRAARYSGILKGDTVAVSFQGTYICTEGIAEDINDKYNSFYLDKGDDDERLFVHTTERCTVVLIKKIEDEESETD